MLNLCLALIVTFFSSDTASEVDYAAHLKQANENKDYCMTFFDLMYAHQYDNSTTRGYFGVATMMQAKVYFNPFTKLAYFNKGKKILETIIQKEPENVELRFLRYAVQKKVPDLLFYNDKLTEDKAVLDEYLLAHDDKLAENIKDFYLIQDTSS
jgi:hypothetical protein